jgi:hypothetical protein
MASIEHCPVCAGRSFAPIYRAPKVPIFCNQYWPTESDAVRAAGGELEIVQCEACSHVFNAAFDAEQIKYAIGYENSLHFSPTFTGYAETLAKHLIDRYGIRGKKILEIGCGDGDFLTMLCESGGNQGFGFDPSQTDRWVDGANGAVVSIRGGYYGPDTRVADVDVICIRHVLEHLPDPGGLLRMLRDLHKDRPNAIAYFEVPNGEFCLKSHGVWDLIYEHVSYFTPQSLSLLLRSCGYRVLDIGLAFGGQFLWAEVALDGAGERSAGLSETGAKADQIRAGYEAMIDASRRRIKDFAARGLKMALWGAGSKGVTFLNIADPARSIETVVDINPRKQNHHIALTGQQVVAPEALAGIQPNVIFIMNRIYIKEIEGALERLNVKAELLSVQDLMDEEAA